MSTIVIILISYVSISFIAGPLIGRWLSKKVTMKITTEIFYTPIQRSQIISSLKSVTHDSLAGYAIRLFAKTADQKSDHDIAIALRNISDQITDNPVTMMRILGNQWVYLKHMAFDAHKKLIACITEPTQRLEGSLKHY